MVLRSRGAAGQGWGSFGEVHETSGKVGAGKDGGYSWDGGELPAPEESPCRGEAWSAGG